MNENDIMSEYLSGEQFRGRTGEIIGNEDADNGLDDSLLVSPILADYLSRPSFVTERSTAKKKRRAKSRSKDSDNLSSIDYKNVMPYRKTPGREKPDSDVLLDTSYCPSLGLGSIGSDEEDDADLENIQISDNLNRDASMVSVNRSIVLNASCSEKIHNKDDRKINHKHLENTFSNRENGNSDGASDLKAKILFGPDNSFSILSQHKHDIECINESTESEDKFDIENDPINYVKEQMRCHSNGERPFLDEFVESMSRCKEPMESHGLEDSIELSDIDTCYSSAVSESDDRNLSSTKDPVSTDSTSNHRGTEDGNDMCGKLNTHDDHPSDASDDLSVSQDYDQFNKQHERNTSNILSKEHQQSITERNHANRFAKPVEASNESEERWPNPISEMKINKSEGYSDNKDCNTFETRSQSNNLNIQDNSVNGSAKSTSKGNMRSDGSASSEDVKVVKGLETNVMCDESEMYDAENGSSAESKAVKESHREDTVDNEAQGKADDTYISALDSALDDIQEFKFDPDFEVTPDCKVKTSNQNDHDEKSLKLFMTSNDSTDGSISKSKQRRDGNKVNVERSKTDTRLSDEDVSSFKNTALSLSHRRHSSGSHQISAARKNDTTSNVTQYARLVVERCSEVFDDEKDFTSGKDVAMQKRRASIGVEELENVHISQQSVSSKRYGETEDKENAAPTFYSNSHKASSDFCKKTNFTSGIKTPAQEKCLLKPRKSEDKKGFRVAFGEATNRRKYSTGLSSSSDTSGNDEIGEGCSLIAIEKKSHDDNKSPVDLDKEPNTINTPTDVCNSVRSSSKGHAMRPVNNESIQNTEPDTFSDGETKLASMEGSSHSDVVECAQARRVERRMSDVNSKDKNKNRDSGISLSVNSAKVTSMPQPENSLPKDCLMQSRVDVSPMFTVKMSSVNEIASETMSPTNSIENNRTSNT